MLRELQDVELINMLIMTMSVLLNILNQFEFIRNFRRITINFFNENLPLLALTIMGLVTFS